MTENPHYLRFARALALVTTLALPACSSSDPSSDGQTKNDKAPAAASNDPPPASSPAPAPSGEQPVAARADAGASTADAGDGDGSPGKISGPLPPPELPSELA